MPKELMEGGPCSGLVVEIPAGVYWRDFPYDDRNATVYINVAPPLGAVISRAIYRRTMDDRWVFVEIRP